ncbi:MAG: HAMP domain-containing sensor histidine kinase [Planctomycetota bacterium]|nr:HAMP domain-containing sensor histidine kinase [Planctomycetota bacterium]
MKIAVLVPDPLLSRALVDLLRTHGHEVHRFPSTAEGCRLRIVTGERAPAPPGCATLELKRAARLADDTAPGDALRLALDEAGSTAWNAPLDTRLLTEVLEGDAHDATSTTAPVLAPDLGSAPHPWIVTDSTVRTVQRANAEALALLRLGPDARNTPVDGLPFGPRLRDALREESEGLRTTQIAGRNHQAAWWTAAQGHRIVCFLPTLGHSHHADRNVRALADLGKTAATLAHEIRNPVASLAGALELLGDETEAAERAEILGMAHARLKQLSRLLEKTLTLARPINGSREPVELQAVIASAVSTMRLDPQFERVSISVDAPAERIYANAYEGPLLQALLNLLLNAAQAQSGDGAVHLALEVDRGRALLRIHDEGPGIPSENRDQVFEPFYTTRMDGTGLGLAEVRRTLEAFDAEIEILDVEQGACFQLELPLARPDA